jgi:hypothetical protein
MSEIIVRHWPTVKPVLGRELLEILDSGRFFALPMKILNLFVLILIFLRRKVPGQTGARTRDLRQHRLALKYQRSNPLSQIAILKRMVLWTVAFRHDI